MKIGLIADIHEDIIRLKSAIQLLEKAGCREIVCLGDIVGFDVNSYGYLHERNAHACIELVREKCKYVVAGNHDLYAIQKLPDFDSGFSYPMTWYELEYEDRKKMSDDQIWLYEESELSALLSRNDKNYLQQLPEYVIADYDDLRILFSHYVYPDFTGSTKMKIKTPKNIKAHFSFMKENNCDLSVTGHGHLDGLIVAGKNKVKEKEFGKQKIKKQPFTAIIPAVANGVAANGVAVLDLKNLEVDIIPLKTPIYKPHKHK